MKKPGKLIAALVFCALNLEGSAQVFCTIPEPPVLQKVTVNPENGAVTVSWKKSPSPGIAAYIVYTYNNGEGIPVDTIRDPEATSYLHVNAGTGYFSVAYVVAAHRMPDCTSPLSNSLNTIFTKADIDTCQGRILISWNRYSSIPFNVYSYSILASRDGTPFQKLAEVPEDQLKYEYTGFHTDAFYSFIVKANLGNGDSSMSNKPGITSRMQKPPDWINADYATVRDNRIQLSFTADPSSELSSYRLERKTGRSGTYSEIARLNSINSGIDYTDQGADVKTINFYRLSAINACNRVTTISNPASNIVLNAERDNNGILLKWNRYESWKGQVASYLIYANTGNGFTELHETTANDSIYNIDYKDIMYKISAGEICFKLEADEAFNPYGLNGSSASQLTCTGTEEVITVPDVFTPNNDLVNDLFIPVLSFTPSEYSLNISNRSGKTVFETRDHSTPWDGSDGGRKAVQGVYLWYLKLKTPSGKVISKTGTVTVYYNQ